MAYQYNFTFIFPIMTKKLEYQSLEVPPPSSTRTNVSMNLITACGVLTIFSVS